MNVTRRDLVFLLPAALFLSAALPELTEAQAGQLSPNPLPSAVYPFASLPVKESPNVITRHILKGRLATGESVEVHETTLPPGGAPHPPHHHVHSEMWLIREGTVEITIEGKPHRIDAGSLAFVRSNEEHGITNPTDKPANYFVVAVGPGADA
jgi:mannose-6-phosphate isomerase-like protein (cupin superfamily)